MHLFASLFATTLSARGDRRGLTFIEYALMGLIVVAIFALIMRFMPGAVDGLFRGVFDGIS